MHFNLTEEEIEGLLSCVSMACSEGLYLVQDRESLETAVEKLGGDLDDIEAKCL